jgi:hypothetical protein
LHTLFTGERERELGTLRAFKDAHTMAHTLFTGQREREREKERERKRD